MIVLFSGGYDSTILALQHIEKITYLLHIEYKHPAMNSELKASKRIYEELINFNSNLKFESVKVPINAKDMFIGAGEKGARYVPNRNSIFLAIASNFAKTRGINTVLYGAAQADQNDYFDCTPEFINLISKALNIDIRAPLLEDTEHKITINQKEVKRILDLSWSCYQPIKDLPCMICNSCTQNSQTK